MKNTMILALLALSLMSTSCAGTPREPFIPISSGAELTADSVIMSSRTTDDQWDTTVQIAEIIPGEFYEGVECLKMYMYYGETAVAWQFSDLGANTPVRISMDANLNFFNTVGYLELTVLPGLRNADEAYYPREEFRKNLALRWADGDPGSPDTTRGWTTIETEEMSADADGDLTVIMVLGRQGEFPPMVTQYITNPVVTKF